jgi:hypothetical protein
MQLIYSSVPRHAKHLFRLAATMIAAAECFLFVTSCSGMASTAAFSPEGATMMRPWSYGDKNLISIEHRKDRTVVVSPSDEQMQSATVIICHGLGDTAEDWCDVAKVNGLHWPQKENIFSFFLSPVYLIHNSFFCQ